MSQRTSVLIILVFSLAVFQKEGKLHVVPDVHSETGTCRSMCLFDPLRRQQLFAHRILDFCMRLNTACRSSVRRFEMQINSVRMFLHTMQ